ncbi:sulfurtransferase [Orrella marina]|uniref:Sulfurtransferase n=1 Tax=Orrella marina TaxID=2163011 RepID=A0A2R4XJ30_9BURK|nr:rhodanese-like domain-containing protein [Orrella marina]AWB33810.1 sulfurtransferase [Orrella marina]
MKHLLTAIASIAISSTVLAAQPLLSPAELSSSLSEPNVRVVDIRDPKSYDEGHIAGAVNAPYGQWRGPAANPGELPELTALTKLVQSIGLEPDTHAIIVSSGANDTDFGAAARVYWTLKVLGLDELSILNGGVKAWQGANLPLQSGSISVTTSSFEPSIDQTLITSRDQLVDVTSTPGSVRALLVDARPEGFFNGETRHTAAKVAGTLEGAVNVPHSLWFKPGTSEVVSQEQAVSLARQHGLDKPDQEIVSFCNTGHWAATNWFVLSELVGDDDVKLYAGSMVDWTQADQALPVQNAPGRLKQLWIDTKLWFETL